jgi:hypothetical protein
MGNDIVAHRAAIGLFYCKINGISFIKVFLLPFVSTIFSAIWRNLFVKK